MRLFKRKDSPVWFVSFFSIDGKRLKRTTHCTDRGAAVAIGRQLEREAASGNLDVRTKATLEDALQLLTDDRTASAASGRGSKATVVYYENKAKALLGGLGATKLLGELAPRTIDAYVRKRREAKMVDHSIAKELVTLRCALKLAKRAGIYSGDIDSLFPPSFSTNYEPRSRVLAPGELNSLFEKLSEDRAALVAFCTACSARWGEAVVARREDVASGMVMLRGTKTVLAARTVPLVAPWQRSLMAYCLQYGRGRDGLLFTPWGSGNYIRDLASACELARIPPVTPNDLRRTCATWLRMQGVPLDLLAAVMGHKDTTMLQRVYARLSPEALQDRIASVLGGDEDTPSGAPETGTPVGHGGGSEERLAQLNRALAARSPTQTASESADEKCSSSARCGIRTHDLWLRSLNVKWATPRKLHSRSK